MENHRRPFDSRYFETKTRMLEIIEQSLRVKLEVNLIEKAFLNVMQDDKPVRYSGGNQSRKRSRTTKSKQQQQQRKSCHDENKENIVPLNRQSPPAKLHKRCNSCKKQLTPIKQPPTIAAASHFVSTDAAEDFSFLTKPTFHHQQHQHQQQQCTTTQATSIWSTDAEKFDSNTPPSIQNLSIIGKSSSNQIREYTSTLDLEEVNYPLHSTLNYPLHSTLNNTSDPFHFEADDGDQLVDSVKTLDKLQIKTYSSCTNGQQLPCIFKKSETSNWFINCPPDGATHNDDDDIHQVIGDEDRFLKRQTGQASLKNLKPAIGLSETDLFTNVKTKTTTNNDNDPNSSSTSFQSTQANCSKNQFRVPNMLPIRRRSKRLMDRNVKINGDYIYFCDRDGRQKTILKRSSTTTTTTTAAGDDYNEELKFSKLKKREIKKKLKQFTNISKSGSDLSDKSVKILGQF